MRRPLAAILLVSLVSIAPRIQCAYADGGPAATGTVADMVARVSAAVVRIGIVRPPKQAADKSAGQPEADKPGGGDAANQVSTAFGSGFIFDPSGYIGTNKHVVEGAISVIVMISDGERFPAKVVGVADKGDIALLHIDAGHPLPFVPFGDSDKMRVGDPVIAIGSPFGLDRSVTAGIISAVNRDIVESPFDNYLQTDAAINHGNSGGPLFNLAGEVIGMISAIYSPDPGSAGVGFAMPSNSLEFVFGRLIKTGHVGAGMLPFHTQQMTWTLQQALGAPDLLGALVISVREDRDAMPDGTIRPGDVIRTFNGQVVQDARDFARKVARAQAGGDAALEIYRRGEIQTVHVTIQEWPEAKPVDLMDEGQRTLGLKLVSGQGEDGKPVVTVVSVDPAGLAADSGVRKGDIIIQVQQTPVTGPDQAMSIFQDPSCLKHHFAAVLVERDKKRFWMSVAVPVK
jgi:serine protease Do